MQKAFSYIILLFSICGFCQNKLLNVEYEIYYNTDRPNTQYANLYINQDSRETIFRKKKNAKKPDEITKGESNEITISYQDKKQNVNYFNFKKDTLLSVENILGEAVLVQESIPKLKWKLINETKVIDSIEVSKAVCDFRGRKYTAWYALSYPISAGPWKLHGLPGLIFEVSDETKRFNWLIKKISYENLETNTFHIDKKDLKITDIKGYCQLRYNNNSWNDKIFAQLPRGATVTDKTIERNGIEIKFEWEE